MNEKQAQILKLKQDKDAVIMAHYYVEDDIILFKIEINKERYNFEGNSMNEEQAWLAIHELEELSYKELERGKYECFTTD